MTKDDIAAVLKQLRLKSGYTQREAAELLGKKQQTVASWETGQSQPDANTLFFICSIYGTTVDEAFGFTHDRKNISSKDIELLEKYHALDALGQSHVDAVLSWESDRVKALADAVAEIASLKGRLETCSSLVSIEDMRPKYYITYYHKLASAGRGEYLFEDIPTDLIAVEDTPVARRADFVIGVIGDSMEPTYHDGDNVFVEKTDIVKVGEIGIFFIGNECFIKEAGADGLISHNSKYPLIPGSDSIRCVGRILGKAERLQHE